MVRSRRGPSARPQHRAVERARPGTKASEDARSPYGDPAGRIVFRRLVKLVCEMSYYLPPDLSPDMEFEADLGFASVTAAEIVARLAAMQGLEPDPDFRLEAHPTLGAVTEYLVHRPRARTGGDDTAARRRKVAAIAALLREKGFISPVGVLAPKR